MNIDEFGRASGLAIDRNDMIYTADSESTDTGPPGLAQGHPHRESERREGDDVRSAAQDRFSRWRHGRRHRHRCRRQYLHRGSHSEGRDEIRQGLRTAEFEPCSRAGAELLWRAANDVGSLRFQPIVKPSSSRPLRKEDSSSSSESDERPLKYPTRGMADCCARRERPRRRAAKQRDELAASHTNSL